MQGSNGHLVYSINLLNVPIEDRRSEDDIIFVLMSSLFLHKQMHRKYYHIHIDELLSQTRYFLKNFALGLTLSLYLNHHDCLLENIAYQKHLLDPQEYKIHRQLLKLFLKFSGKLCDNVFLRVFLDP